MVRICTFKSLYLCSFLLKRYCVRTIVIVISFPFLFEVSHEEKADVSVKCLQELFNSKYSMSIYIIFIKITVTQQIRCKIGPQRQKHEQQK